MPIVLPSSSGTTIGNLIDELAAYLSAGTLGQLNELDGAVTDDATTIKFKHRTNMPAPGSWLGVGLEVMYVWDTQPGASTATVRRGMGGSNALEHSSGTIVELHPRFSRFQLMRTLQQEIAGWPPSLYALHAVTLNVSSSTNVFDFADIEDSSRILEAAFWPTSGAPRDLPFTRIMRHQDEGNLESGVGIVLSQSVGPGTVRVVFSTGFDLGDWTEVTTASSIGLTESMLDIPVIGGAARLMLAREAPRSDTYAQGQARLAEEVPPGSILQNARELERMTDKRLAREARRLRELFPYREA